MGVGEGRDMGGMEEGTEGDDWEEGGDDVEEEDDREAIIGMVLLGQKDFKTGMVLGGASDMGEEVGWVEGCGVVFGGGEGKEM